MGYLGRAGYVGHAPLAPGTSCPRIQLLDFYKKIGAGPRCADLRGKLEKNETLPAANFNGKSRLEALRGTSVMRSIAARARGSAELELSKLNLLTRRK